MNSLPAPSMEMREGGQFRCIGELAELPGSLDQHDNEARLADNEEDADSDETGRLEEEHE